MSKFAIILAVLIGSQALALDQKASEAANLQKSQLASQGFFDGNRVKSDLENNGMLVSHRLSGHSGLEWPKGSRKYSVYAAGPWIIGKVNGELRSAITDYAPEFTAGPWGSDGTDSSDVLYKVNQLDIYDPAINPDFANWPTQAGAPWVDVDEDGQYNPMPNGVDHPDFLGDQVMYYVMNDGIADDHRVFNTEPLGIEVRVTIWGYDRQDVFGDAMFVKFQIFNKGGNEIEDMYFGAWADPDLGDAGDDFVGCDTSLALGYCYNDGEDRIYQPDPAPAVGIQFLQVAAPTHDLSQQAYCFGDMQTGFQDLGMTSFIKYIGGDDIYSDPNDVLEGFNYLRGYNRVGNPFLNSATGDSTKFVHSDDPNLNIDRNDLIWVDSDDNPSDDRRFLMGSGPFHMSAGDSAEVVLVLMHGQGANANNSVTTLKQIAALTQAVHDRHYAAAEIPATPTVTATTSSKRIILEWDNLSETYSSLDRFSTNRLEFEGYNIYQFENAAGTGAYEKIATYDIINGITIIEDFRFFEAYQVFAQVPVQLGTDSGLRHSISIENDAIGGDVPFIDDRAYFFAVTAYAYGAETEPHATESDFDIIEVRPQSNVILNPVAILDTPFEVEHTSSSYLSDGSVHVNVSNPLAVTGHDYSIAFDTLTFEGHSSPTTVWNLSDISSGQTILTNQTVQAGIDGITGIKPGPLATLTADGLQLQVNNPPDGLHGVWQTANANGSIEGVDENVNENIIWINFLTAPDYPTSQAQISNGGWFFVTHGGGTANDIDSFYARVFGGSNFSRAIPHDFEMRFTEEALESGMGYRRFLDRVIIPVPFELWNLGDLPGDASDDFRMLPAILNGSELGEGEDNIDVWDFWGDDPNSGAKNDPSSDWIYWGNPIDQTPGQAGYDSFFASGVATAADDSNNWIEVMAATRLMNWNAYVSHTGFIALTALSSADPLNWTAADTALFIAEGFFIDALNSSGIVEVEGNSAVGTILDMPEVGTVYRWITNKPNGLADVFTFSTQGFEPEVLAYDKNNIKVWPNPYFGHNPEEVRLDEHRIHFINLPDQATIRIVTLAGQILKIIEHSGSQEAIWDVRNASNALVASGVYIAIVDTEYGQEVLKIAVVARPF